MMSENRLDRTNLKRQAQRVESYSSLLSKRKSKTDTFYLGKSRLRCGMNSYNQLEYLKEGGKENKGQCLNNFPSEQFSSPTSENQSSSSDSSQEFHPSPYRNWKPVHKNSTPFESDLSPVMTRSAARKFASVGAIFNRVNFKQELKINKKWPISVSYPLSNLPVDHLQLKDIMSRSLNSVMSFCKDASVITTEKLKKNEKENVQIELDEHTSLIDLSPYLSQEQMTISGNPQSQITFHLNENLLSHQFINVIAMNNEEESQALVIQDDENDLETITLHSGETYVLDSKYIPNSNCIFVDPKQSNTSKNCLGILPDNPMMAVYNDHTYAMRYTENTRVASGKTNQMQDLEIQNENEFKLQDILKDLLMNTAILKCLVSGETPQDLIGFLKKSQNYNIN